MEDKYRIREVIVVEGKSDVAAVKRAFDGNIDVIATHGLGLSHEFLEELADLNDRKGIIVLTDPDYAGRRIESIIREYAPSAKFASISRRKAFKNSDIGVENASDEAIIAAIERARPQYEEKRNEFTIEDIMDNGLSGGKGSKERRIKLCEKLGIGYANGKQLLSKLNAYDISRQDFYDALSKIGDKDD